ncbi:MAG: AarF/UbiB family protein [Gemmataceae bacterium]
MRSSDVVAQLDRLLPRKVVKQNRQRTVSRIEAFGGMGECYVKSCRVDGFRAWFRELFRGPKARLEYRHAQRLASLGLPPSSQSPGRARVDFWPGPSQIVTRGVPNAIPLDEYLERRASLTLNERRQISLSLAEFFATLYRHGVVHPDPHPGNLLVAFDAQGRPQLTLLDVHVVQFFATLTKEQIVSNLVLINRWSGHADDASGSLAVSAELVRLLPFADRECGSELERLTLN